MTQRERLALILVAVGAVCLTVAAAAYGGWVLAVAAVGVLAVVGGVLLGLDAGETVSVPDELDL